MTDKPRLHYIDFMKGLCILFIVVVHIDYRVYDYFGSRMNFLLESFRMPMYYFISGIFFKTYMGFSDFVRKKVNNIVVPLVFFYLLSCALIAMVQYMFHWYGHTAFEWSFLLDPLTQRLWNANVPMWFLMSLFEVNIMYYALRKLLRSDGVILFVALSLAWVGYRLIVSKTDVPLLLDTALVGLPYFVYGSLVKRIGGLNPSPYDRWGVLVLLGVLVSLYPFAQELDIWLRHLPNYFYLFLVPLVSILALLWASKRLSYVPLICYIGRYSLVVLCTHFLVIPVAEATAARIIGFQNPKLAVAMTILLVIVAELVIIKVFIKLFPRFTAQKELFAPGWKLRVNA